MDNDGTGMIKAKTLDQLRVLLARKMLKEKDVIAKARQASSEKS